MKKKSIIKSKKCDFDNLPGTNYCQSCSAGGKQEKFGITFLGWGIAGICNKAFSMVSLTAISIEKNSK